MTDAIDTSSPSPNPFDPAALRLDQSYADTVGVKKLLTTVPVRKPNRQDFVRVHPDPKYRLTPAAIIEVKEDREHYLVTPGMAQALPGEFAIVTLFTTITRQGTLHLWPVKLPTPEGRQNEWHRSVWPDYSFEEILKIAFRDRIVDRADHPLVQRLQGIV